MTTNHPSIVEVDSKPVFYHGSWAVTRDISKATTQGPGMGMTLSASVNVARRYGPLISCFELKDCVVASLTPEELYQGGAPEHHGKVPAILVTGDTHRYDFPVDLLFVSSGDILTFSRVLTPEDITLLDDGLPFLNTPLGPVDRDWNLWVSQMHQGDIQSALEDIGWHVADNRYTYCVRGDTESRDWNVKVYLHGGHAPLEFAGVSALSWIVESDFGESAVLDTLPEALLCADRWSRQHRLEREAQRRARRPAPRQATPLAEGSLDDDDLPF